MVKVYNLESPRSGRPVANQFVIQTDDGEYFQSYKTVIAFRDRNGQITLNEYWNYSNTTRKYLSIFLANISSNFGMGKKEIQKAVEDGVFRLAKLN